MEQNFIARHRIGVSRIFFIGLIGIALFGGNQLPENAVMRVGTLLLAYGFVIIAVLGRLWCSLYLCGYKTSALIDVGPFSIVRNPLYLFSFIGATGIAIATTSIPLTLLIIAFFLLIYPAVIANEEKRLETVLGEDYLAYKERTPKALPNFKLYKGVKQYTINIKQVHSAFLDVVWFFIALALARLVPMLYGTGALPIGS